MSGELFEPTQAWAECEVDGCLRPNIKDGLCSDHWWAYIRGCDALIREVRDFLTNDPHVGFAAYCRENGLSV